MRFVDESEYSTASVRSILFEHERCAAQQEAEHILSKRVNLPWLEQLQLQAAISTGSGPK